MLKFGMFQLYYIFSSKLLLKCEFFSVRSADERRSPHEPLHGGAVRPAERLGDEDVNGGGVDGGVQQELPGEPVQRGEGHVQAVHQVRHDEVAELQELLGNGGARHARQVGQAPEERARLQGVQEVPAGEDVRRAEEETHQLVPLVNLPPHVEGEVAVVCQEVLVDEGELPHEQQRERREEEEEERLLPDSLEEAEQAVVAERDGEGEEEGEGEEVEDLGEVEAGFVARPVAHDDPVVKYDERQERHAHRCVRPRPQKHRLHVAERGEELQGEKQHFLHSAERQRDLGGRRLLVPLLRMLRPPGLVHLGGRHRARAERHPDDVGLAEEHGADAEERRGLVAAVQRHEVGEEDEEGRPRVRVVQEVEEVEHREGGQGQRRQDSARGRSCLEEEQRDVRTTGTTRPPRGPPILTFSLRCSLQSSR